MEGVCRTVIRDAAAAAAAAAAAVDFFSVVVVAHVHSTTILLHTLNDALYTNDAAV